MNIDSCRNYFFAEDEAIQKNSKKAFWVLIITGVMMILEIYFGFTTGSMALLADGWHMATHVAALGITFYTYRLASHPKMAKNFNFGGGKIIALGGFASSIFLLCVVVLIGFESTDRLLHPEHIQFNEALLVATIGLIVNLICAYILRDEPHHHGHSQAHGHNHDHDHGDHDSHEHPNHHHNNKQTSNHAQDHNIRGAYLHVVADAITSVGAMIALFAGKYYGLSFLDPLIGLVGALVIFKWSITLIKDTGWELLDGHARQVNFEKLKKRIQSTGAEILDLHVWKIAPRMLACELIVRSKSPLGLVFYRQILEEEFEIKHSVIEERS